MESVELSFRYTEEDYVRAMRTHYASRLRVPLDIAVIAGGVVLGVYEWRSGSPVFGIFLLSAAGILALILVAAFIVIPKVSFRREPKFRNEYSLKFSSEKIHFRTSHIDSDIDWGMYTRVLVDAYSFILYSGSQQFTVIPQRVFQDSSQRQTFEQLLKQNVLNVLDRTKRA